MPALIMAPMLYLGWLALTAGQAPVWGVLVALAVAGGSCWLNPAGAHAKRRGLRSGALLMFVGFFLRHSLIGGLDVAWRAFHPRMPLQRRWLHYPLRLRGDAPRALFLGTLTVTPGTLAADLQGDVVLVHVIIGNVEPGLMKLERKVAALFGQTLSEQPLAQPSGRPPEHQP